MANIIWAGTRFFGPKLEELGHKVYFVPHEPDRAFTWTDLLRRARLPSGQRPDLVMVADQSAPPFVLGVEAFPCLTAFYAVDSHIHSWYPNYAQAFDFCLFSLKDHLPLFSDSEIPPERLLWSPPYMLDKVTEHETASAPDKTWDLLFVGKVEDSVNPERLTFLRNLKVRLGGIAELHWQSGNFLKLFPKARLVLNHSIAGDLNFRVMEALGCGACLLTPRVRNGQSELFEDGRDLFLFDQGSAAEWGELVDLIERLLQSPELCARTAACGLEKVNSEHLAIHRAKSFSEAFSGLLSSGTAKQAQTGAAALVSNRLARHVEIRKNYLRLIYLLLAESEERPALRKAYLEAAKPGK